MQVRQVKTDVIGFGFLHSLKVHQSTNTTLPVYSSTLQASTI